MAGTRNERKSPRIKASTKHSEVGQSARDAAGLSALPLAQIAFEHASVGLCLVDADTRVLLVNRQWLRMLHVSAEAVLDHLIFDACPALHDALAKPLANLSFPQAVPISSYRLSLDAEERWLEGDIAAVALPDGPGKLITLRDVTTAVLLEQERAQLLAELKEANHQIITASMRQEDLADDLRRQAGELNEANQQLIAAGLREQVLSDEFRVQAIELDAIVQSLGNAVIIYGTAGEILRMNRRAEALLGFNLEHYRAMSPDERERACLVEPASGHALPPDESPVAHALRGDTVLDYHLMLLRADGKSFHVLDNASPIRDENGKILGAVVSLSDVTQLIELIRLRDDLTSIVAHDLRQPLTAIYGESQLIQKALDSGKQDMAKRSAKTITKSAQRLNVMIQDLLDSVRSEAHRFELHRSPIDLNSFLRDILQRAAVSYDTARVKVRLQPGLPALLADPDRIERIILNLISNSLKYSSPGTPVEIDVTGGRHEIRFSVKDHGFGIPPEDQAHLFERFFRARQSQHPRDSIGLGLYITRVLVEAHGGHIWVESTPGKGSTFTFTLPLN